MVMRRPQYFSPLRSSPLPARERIEGEGPCSARIFRARFKVLLFSFVLSGCARVAPPAPRPVLVNIPIATPIYCDVPALQPPPLAIASLTADSPPADTVRSYAATVDVLKSAVRERDAILKGCAAPASLRGPSAPQTPLGMTRENKRVASTAPVESSRTIAGALFSKLRGLLPW